MLGRCLLAAEDDLPSALERLVERAEFSWDDGGALPDVLVLDPEAVVWVVRLGGNLTGRVGDFGLGLTKPPGEALTGAVFFSLLGFAAFGVVGGWDAVLVGLLAGFGCGAGSGACLLATLLAGAAGPGAAGPGAPAGRPSRPGPAGPAAAGAPAGSACAPTDVAGVFFPGVCTAFTPFVLFTSPPAPARGAAAAPVGVDFAGVPRAFTPFVLFASTPAGAGAGVASAPAGAGASFGAGAGAGAGASFGAAGAWTPAP